MGNSAFPVPAGTVNRAAVADAYDMYADHVYAYCRFLAPDPGDAATALENTFLAVAGRSALLPSDRRLRTWMFAVARNEHLRAMTSRGTSPGADPRPGGPPDQGEQVLLTAAEGLAPQDRDLFALLWHGLEAGDLTVVLGISREEALTRLEKTRERLEAAARTLLAARPGGMSSARKLSLTYAALRGAGVSADVLGSFAATVAALREQVLDQACDPSAEGGEAREWACGQIDPFGSLIVRGDDGSPASPETGFGEPLAAAGASRRLPWVRIAASAVAVAAVATIAAVVTTGQTPAARSTASGTGPGVSLPAVSGSPARTPAPPSRVPRPPEASATASRSPSPPPAPTASPSSSPRSRPPANQPGLVSVPSSVTITFNLATSQYQGTLPVSVRGGGPAAWSVSNPNAALSLSRSSGTSSASVEITGYAAQNNVRPLTVTAGSESFTVNITVVTP